MFVMLFTAFCSLVLYSLSLSLSCSPSYVE